MWCVLCVFACVFPSASALLVSTNRTSIVVKDHKKCTEGVCKGRFEQGTTFLGNGLNGFVLAVTRVITFQAGTTVAKDKEVLKAFPTADDRNAFLDIMFGLPKQLGVASIPCITDVDSCAIDAPCVNSGVFKFLNDEVTALGKNCYYARMNSAGTETAESCMVNPAIITTEGQNLVDISNVKKLVVSMLKAAIKMQKNGYIHTDLSSRNMMVRTRRGDCDPASLVVVDLDHVVSVVEYVRASLAKGADRNEYWPAARVALRDAQQIFCVCPDAYNCQDWDDVGKNLLGKRGPEKIYNVQAYQTAVKTWQELAKGRLCHFNDDDWLKDKLEGTTPGTGENIIKKVLDDSEALLAAIQAS